MDNRPGNSREVFQSTSVEPMKQESEAIANLETSMSTSNSNKSSTTDSNIDNTQHEKASDEGMEVGEEEIEQQVEDDDDDDEDELVEDESEEEEENAFTEELYCGDSDPPAPEEIINLFVEQLIAFNEKRGIFMRTPNDDKENQK